MRSAAVMVTGASGRVGAATSIAGAAGGTETVTAGRSGLPTRSSLATLDAWAGAPDRSAERAASGRSGGRTSSAPGAPAAMAERANRDADQIRPNRHTLVRGARMLLLLKFSGLFRNPARPLRSPAGACPGPV